MRRVGIVNVRKIAVLFKGTTHSPEPIFADRGRKVIDTLVVGPTRPVLSVVTVARNVSPARSSDHPGVNNSMRTLAAQLEYRHPGAVTYRDGGAKVYRGGVGGLSFGVGQ